MPVRPLLLVLACVAPWPALAGPPYLTDDPEPVGYGHWEIYGLSSATWARGASAGILPGVDLNYGAWPDVQLHMAAQISFNRQAVTGTQFGYGDTAFGVKYRFVDPDKNDDWQVSTYPMVVAPTGDAARGLGTGSPHEYLPIWVQKDLGQWTTYGGGGYWINPGPGNRNWWYFGWQLQRKVSDSLALGAELFHQTISLTSGPGSVGFPLGSEDATGFNVGAIYDLTEHDHLLFSAGRGLQNAAATNEFSYYFSYQWTY
jgi:hypothetical protein